MPGGAPLEKGIPFSDVGMNLVVLPYRPSEWLLLKASLLE
jgi:hypothetical protein